MPRTRPPFPAVSGLWGKPTNINNVETFSNVPVDHRQRRRRPTPPLGTESCRAPRPSASPARSSTAASPRCRWAPRLRHVIFDVGGGIKDGQQVQGRAARRPLRRLRAGQPAGHAGRLREPRRDRRHRRLRRHGRGRRQAPAWSTWPGTSCSSPRTRAAASACPAASAPSACSRSSSASPPATASQGDIELLEELAVNIKKTQPLRPRPDGARTRCSPPSSTSATSTRRTSTSTAARPARCKALIAYVIDAGGLHRLHAVRQEVPDRRGTRREEAAARHRRRRTASSATPAARPASSTPSRSSAGPDEIAAAVDAQHT